VHWPVDGSRTARKRAARRISKLRATGQEFVVEAVRSVSDFRCASCGLGTNLTRHHLRPLGSGGKSGSRNLLKLCALCHKAVHHGFGEGHDYAGPRLRAGLALDARRIAELLSAADGAGASRRIRAKMARMFANAHRD